MSAKILKFTRPNSQKKPKKKKKSAKSEKHPKFTPEQHTRLAEKLEVERHQTVTKFIREANAQGLDEAAVAALSGIRTVQTVRKLWTFETVLPRNETMVKVAWGLGLQIAYLGAKKAAAAKKGRTKLKVGS